MEHKIFIAGFGGQGVVLAGNILAEAGLKKGKNVTSIVSYGAEMRGGTANCSLIISDDEILSPVVDKPDISIILNEPSLDKFEKIVKENGLIILNKTLVGRDVKRKDVKVIEIEATKIANEIGNIKTANVVMIGALLKETELFNVWDIEEVFQEMSGKNKALFDINKKALLEGHNFR